MLDKLKIDLANNYLDDDDVLTNLIDYFQEIASHQTNRDKDDSVLYPYVYDAVKKAYLRRGNEGMNSSSVGSISSSYSDIVEDLKNNIRALRIFVL